MDTEKKDGESTEVHRSIRGLSRREMLATGVGAAAGLVGMVMLPQTAAATDGDAIRVGGVYTGSSSTQITCMVPSATLGSIPSTVAGFGYTGADPESHVGVEGRVCGGMRSGIGVYGVTESAESTGVHAADAFIDWYGTHAAGTALRVDGIARFSRSGKGSIVKGKATASVTVSRGVATDALVLVTLQNSPGSGVYLQYAQRTSSTTFRVVLNKNATTKTYFSWMVIN